MPSSTFSSDRALNPGVQREIPDQPWLSLFGVALVLVALAVIGWESHVRGLGYAPSYDDTPNLWAPQRARARDARPNQVVFVGASRTLFDMDLATFQEETGGPLPIQLATVGSNPLIVLEDLAGDPSYAGTTIVGVVPGLFAAAGGPPVTNPAKYVKHYRQWSPADRLELPLTLLLEERLALINQDELTLPALIDSWDLPLRPGVHAPKLPGYLATLDRVRQAKMRPEVVNVEAVRQKVQQIWLPLFSGPPKPGAFSDEQWRKILSEGWESNLGRLKKSVNAIVERGGKVIFSRLPSSGKVRELEARLTPRAAFWERILQETGAPGVHFEDFAELSAFDCPEWSHLSASDATEYTRRFARILTARDLL